MCRQSPSPVRTNCIMPELLTDEERVAFEEAASRIYNAICHDMGWTLRLPAQSIFVDVISGSDGWAA